MVFSSLIFLYGFFPLSMLVYALCKTQTAKNTALLIFSLIFYAWGEPKYVFLLMFMAFNAWGCALGVEKANTKGWKLFWVFLSSAVDILLIGWFKYAGLICSIFWEVPEFISSIALPIGISFYTFQLLTYVVDVYRKDAPAQKNYFNVLLYAALFHQCIAGPIVRYKTVDSELFGPEPRKPDLAIGVSRFCAGLAKKALLANPCGALADQLILSDSLLSDPSRFVQNLSFLSEQSVLGAWIGILAYGLHIYLDFSAYSDMAIGMGRMIGLHYLENFNYPYISRTVTEFWRRWHMSLGTFFRDYVYIPLGGSRCGWLRSLVNTLIVWALTGIWHGASWNFLLWGLWFFVFLMIERLFLKKILERVPVLSNLYLLIVVSLGWVIFRFTNMEYGITLIKSLFGMNKNPISGFLTVNTLQSNMFLLIFCAVTCTPVAKIIRNKVETLLMERSLENRLPGKIWQVVFYSLIPVILLLLVTSSLVGDSYNPFIYFQF